MEGVKSLGQLVRVKLMLVGISFALATTGYNEGKIFDVQVI